MTTTTVWAVAGSPALPEGVLAEAFCPDADAVTCPDPGFADVCGAADPHADRASAAAASAAAASTTAGLTRAIVSCAARTALYGRR